MNSITLDAGPLQHPSLVEKAHVRFSARVPGAATDALLEGDGWVIPGAGDLKLNFQIRDLDLTQLSPYYGRWLSGELRKGRADFEIDARARAHALQAQCRLVLRNLEFSGGTNSASVFGIPGTLLTAYLLREEGRIELVFPIEGRLDRPMVDWASLVAPAMKASFQNALQADLSAILGAGEGALGKVLDGTTPLEEALPESMKEFSDEVGGLLKGLLGREEPSQ